MRGEGVAGLQLSWNTVPFQEPQAGSYMQPLKETKYTSFHSSQFVGATFPWSNLSATTRWRPWLSKNIYFVWIHFCLLCSRFTLILQLAFGCTTATRPFQSTVPVSCRNAALIPVIDFIHKLAHVVLQAQERGLNVLMQLIAFVK